MEFKLFVLLLITMPCSILGFNHCNFPAIFNFGDSNSDTGGLTAMFGERLLPPPHGDTFFHASGRFSDGRVILDFMVEKLGLPYVSAFLDSIGSNFSHGVNFATGGSSIRPPNKTFHESGFSPISLDVQLAQFSDFLKRSNVVRKQESFGKLLPKEEYLSRALYTLDIGHNDLSTCFDIDMPIDEVKAIVPDLLGQFSIAVKKLYIQGARSFWIHNIGPMGCSPFFVDRFINNRTQFDEHGCFGPYNNVTQYFNLGLKKIVLQLRKELPLTAITYVDIYSAKYNLISQAYKLGFGNPFVVCCGYGGTLNFNRHFYCGREYVVQRDEFQFINEAANNCISDPSVDGLFSNSRKIVVSSCEDPSARISWDGAHYTEAANKWVFDQIVDGSFSDPPIPLEFACNTMNS